MKALTIFQPYASLIVGWPGMPEEVRKRVENRDRYCKHRGPLLIHAGQARDWLWMWGGPVPEDMPFGALIGQVTVADCVVGRVGWRNRQYPWLDTHIHASGPNCIILENPVRFETPIPYRGMPGLFNVPDEVLEETS